MASHQFKFRFEMTDTNYRFLKANPADLKLDSAGARTLPVLFSSETPVLRQSKSGEKFYEVLSHDPAHVDLSLLQNGGAFLDEHKNERQVGSVLKAWLDTAQKVCRAILAFGNTQLADERFELMSSGHRKDISFGYELLRVVSQKIHTDGIPIKVYAWRVFEISTVAVGADHFKTGVGRSAKPNKKNSIHFMDKSTKRTEMVARERSLLHSNPHAANEIREVSTRATLEDWDLARYSEEMMKAIQSVPRPYATAAVRGSGSSAPGTLGMSGRDLSQYSLARAIRSAAENGGRPKGFEGDVADQCVRSFGQNPEGFFVPTDVIVGKTRSFAQRDMTVGTFGNGGALVPTQVPTSIIELLRNQSICLRAGATFLGGLTGNMAMPRQTSANQPQSLGETAQVNNTDITIDQVPMSPKRVSANTIYSKQLVLQSSPDVEAAIQRDLITTVAIKHDYLMINGSGANDEPLGILTAPNVQQLTFGGAASWAKIVDFETKLGNMNADRGALAYATSPSVKGIWKTTAVALTGATTVSSRVLWEEGNFGDDSTDGKVNSYRAMSTNQIPGNRVIFGNWNDLVFGMWGGLDIIVDPYTLSRKAEISVVVHSWIDSVLRHPQSFCVSIDAGNQ